MFPDEQAIAFVKIVQKEFKDPGNITAIFKKESRGGPSISSMLSFEPFSSTAALNHKAVLVFHSRKLKPYTGPKFSFKTQFMASVYFHSPSSTTNSPAVKDHIKSELVRVLKSAHVDVITAHLGRTSSYVDLTTPPTPGSRLELLMTHSSEPEHRRGSQLVLANIEVRGELIWPDAVRTEDELYEQLLDQVTQVFYKSKANLITGKDKEGDEFLIDLNPPSKSSWEIPLWKFPAIDPKHEVVIYMISPPSEISSLGGKMSVSRKRSGSRKAPRKTRKRRNSRSFSTKRSCRK